jgi:GTP-binding protein
VTQKPSKKSASPAKPAKKGAPAPKGGKPAQGKSAPGGFAKTEGARPGDRVVKAEFAAGAQGAAQFPPPVLVEIAFAGRSNVGKSSLMNRLVERRNLVRTSQTPGCTRQVSWFDIETDDGARMQLVDLPGYGYAKRSKTERQAWGTLIDDYLLGRATLRGVVVLADVRRGFEEEDLELLKMLAAPSRTSRPKLEVILVATKLDKLPRSQHKVRLDEIGRDAGARVLGFSSLDGTGRDALWRRLRRVAGIDAVPVEAEPEPKPAASE